VARGEHRDRLAIAGVLVVLAIAGATLRVRGRRRRTRVDRAAVRMAAAATSPR
jgi:hypothetical protein